VTLPRPRDISEVRMEKQFHELHREIWSVLKDEVMKGYAQSDAKCGGRLMSRLTLLFWQLMVAVVALSLWAVPRHRAGVRPHPAAAVLLLKPGRCRQPDRQMVLLRRGSGSIWMITLCGVDAGFRDRLVSAACWFGFWFARKPLVAAVFDPICEDDQRAAARGCWRRSSRCGWALASGPRSRSA